MVVLLDVNVLLYAHREEIPDYSAYRLSWNLSDDCRISV